jgi:hypothetical protein
MKKLIEQEIIKADAPGEGDQWEQDEIPKDDAEVIKLKVGESIEGLLTDKLQSSKYDTMIYKIKCKDDELVKIILGTTLLDHLMKDKPVGDLVKIERLADSPSKQGKPLQN